LMGLDPLVADSDGDGLSDLQQVAGCELGGDGGFLQPGAVEINEVLAYSELGAPDWIELYNTTDEPINIGGWFLSDDGQNLRKYEIEDPTIIEPDGYCVFYQNIHFGNDMDPGSHEQFGLNEDGETLYLSSGRDGLLTGYREEQRFGTSENGVAFGRYFKDSTGESDFVAMSRNTPGEPNAVPKVGPIVITEIMYDPESGDQNQEYLELVNITDARVNLFDADGNPWRFTDGIDFIFPAGTMVAPGGYVIVAKDLTAFIAQYSAPAGVLLLGPYDGQLRNGGERIEIAMPGKPDRADGLQYVQVDSLEYDNEEPWPTEPAGAGASLTRIEHNEYGNDLANWRSAEPTPGSREED